MAFDLGGLATATQEEEEPTPTGLGGSTRMTLEEMLAESNEPFPEQQYLERFQETAEQSREALRSARERILSQKYDPRQKWLAAAAAFGSSTQTGQFGETLGSVAGALQAPYAAEQKFKREQESQLLGLDQALVGVDESLIGNELQLYKLKEAQQSRYQEKSMALALVREKQFNQNMTHESGMRKEFNTLLKDYEKVSDAYGRVQAAATNPSAAGDLAMIFNFMKMLDPGSTVREGEFATAAATTGVPGRLVTWYNNVLEGERLNVDQRKDFLDKARQLYDTALEGAQFKSESYRALAIRNNLDPEDVIAVFTSAKDRFSKPAVKVSVTMPDGGTFEVAQSLVDAGDKKEIARLYEEHKQEYAKGGRVKFQEGGAVNFDDIEEEEDISFEELEESEDFDVKELLGALGGAGVGVGVGLAGLEAETRLTEMQTELTRGTSGERKIVEAMEIGGMDPQEVMLEARRGQRMGVPERPIDTGGRMTRVLGERALVAGDDPAEEALHSLEERHAGSRERVSGQIEKRFKAPEYFAEEDKLTSRLYENARPAYEKAWKENTALAHPPFWKRLHSNKYGEQAIHMALDFMDDIAQEPIGKKNIAGWVEHPSLKFLDQVKRGFDQMIRKEENMGATPLGRHLRAQRKMLVDWLDDPKNVTPAYAAARKQYKGDLEILEALDTGRTQYLKMSTKEAQRLLDGMGWAERNALRAGVTQRLYEQLDSPTADINAARRLLGSPSTSEKLELLFDKPREFAVFKAAIRREMELFDQGRRLTRRAESGRTRRMTKELLEQHEYTPGTIVKMARAMRPVEWVMRLFDHEKLKLSAKDADEIIQILNEGDVRELSKIGDRLEKVSKSRKHRKAPHRSKGKAAAVGAAVGAALGALGFGDDEDEE